MSCSWTQWRGEQDRLRVSVSTLFEGPAVTLLDGGAERATSGLTRHGGVPTVLGATPWASSPCSVRASTLSRVDPLLLAQNRPPWTFCSGSTSTRPTTWRSLRPGLERALRQQCPAVSDRLETPSLRILTTPFTGGSRLIVRSACMRLRRLGRGPCKALRTEDRASGLGLPLTCAES